jgi:Ras-related GTP-binding protein C/D
LDFFDPAFDSEAIFGGCGAIVFVIDAQDDYGEALGKLHKTVTKAHQVRNFLSFFFFVYYFLFFYFFLSFSLFSPPDFEFLTQVNPNIKFEVFIHKVDGLSDDHKIGIRFTALATVHFR